MCVQAAAAALREQSCSNQPAESEQQVGHAEQEQRLQLQTHKPAIHTMSCGPLKVSRIKEAIHPEVKIQSLSTEPHAHAFITTEEAGELC